MATVGIELSDAAFQAATCQDRSVQCHAIADDQGISDWPGFAYFDGQKYAFGRLAEDQWLIHPRRVTHAFWSRLAHEPSTIGPPGKPAPFSELAFHHCREFVQRIPGVKAADRCVLAVPGSFLKDSATEEEKIGLLLGIAGELKLPLAGIVDMATAALCDPRAPGFNPSLPVVLIDVHLDGTELTLLSCGDQLQRKDFIHLPQASLIQLLKHLNSTMGNRFLRQTAFDILEDGRIEQTFFRQTKDFLLSGASEHRYQINTSSRTYEMLAKRDQLAADAQTFGATLVQGLQAFLQNSPHASAPCTIVLTARAASLPGLESRLHVAGHHRILRLSSGAAACGAAFVGEQRLGPARDLAEVPVETSLPSSLAKRTAAARWETHLQRMRGAGDPSLVPTHVVLEGLAHPLASSGRFVIGTAGLGADLSLPDAFHAADDCAISLLHDGGRLWLLDTALPRTAAEGAPAGTSRLPLGSGDRLVVHCGTAAAELLFVHVGPLPHSRGPN